MTNIVYKNMEDLYTVLQCPRCLKLVFVKKYIPEEQRKYHKFKCCECEEELNYLDIETSKVEIEV